MIKDWHAKPFRRMVVMGESTVAGGEWLQSDSERWADVLVDQINRCQVSRVGPINKGIGANAISPRSPGYEASAKPSALERYGDDVIAEKPDLFLLCYGLNDMRAGTPVDDFVEDMRTIIDDVREACDPLIVLTTIYYMTSWKSFPPFNRGSVELTENYNAAIAVLAQEHGCLLSDLWEAEGGRLADQPRWRSRQPSRESRHRPPSVRDAGEPLQLSVRIDLRARHAD